VAWASEGGRGDLVTHWILKILSKKSCFLSFEWEKTNFTTFAPPWKNPLVPPPGKHSSDAHAWRIITAYYIALKIQVPHAKLQRTSAKSVNELDNTNTMPKKNSCFHTKIHFHSRQNAQRQNNFDILFYGCIWPFIFSEFLQTETTTLFPHLNTKFW